MTVLRQRIEHVRRMERAREKIPRDPRMSVLYRNWMEDVECHLQTRKHTEICLMDWF